jgi:hypothetical protein
MNMTQQKKTARRSFLAGMGLAAAAGVAAKLSPPSAPAQTSAPPEPQGDSYRLTEHVKKYYRTTTI